MMNNRGLSFPQHTWADSRSRVQCQSYGTRSIEAFSLRILGQNIIVAGVRGRLQEVEP